MTSRGWRAPAWATAVGAVAVLTVVAPAAHAAVLGTLLLEETFADSSVEDARAIGLDDACLTAALAAPSAESSQLGPCASSVGAPTTGAEPGYLQLTDARGTRVGGLLFDRALPSSAGLVVQFDQYQYGGSGADGIGFFLTDGSMALTDSGAPGGSLGYAQRWGVDGIDGGYLGVGLDAFGNYALDTEDRGAGCDAASPYTAAVPNAVSLRGPGEGVLGYCLLATSADADGVSTLSGSLRSATGPEDALRNVRITVSPGVLPLVTVEIDFTGTRTAYEEVLSYQMTDEAPHTYKWGFSASTGGSNDVHLVRNVDITTVDTLGELSVAAQVDHTLPQPSAYSAGATIPVQFVVTSTGLEPISKVDVTSPTVTDIVCPSTSLGAAGGPTASMVCTGSLPVTAADTAADTLVIAATASAKDSFGGPLAADDDVTVALEAPEPALQLSATARLVEANDDGAANPGETITYALTATNVGNVPLTGLVLDDGRGGAILCDAAALTVGESTECLVDGTHAVTEAEAAAGEVRYSATASAQVPDGVQAFTPVAASVVTPAATVPVPAAPARLSAPSPAASGEPAAAGDAKVVVAVASSGLSTDASAATPALAETGVTDLWAATAAAVLTAVGAALLVVRRRASV